MYFPGVHLYLGVRTETKPWAASPCVGGEAQGSLCGELSGCLGAVSSFGPSPCLLSLLSQPLLSISQEVRPSHQSSALPAARHPK